MEWPNVQNLGSVEADEAFDLGPFRGSSAELASMMGATRLGFHLDVLPPGAFGCPYHFHHAEEELFLVLTGRLLLRQCGRFRELGPQDLVLFPPGPEGAHQFFNPGPEPARILALSTRSELEVCEYPDSGKLMVRAAGRIFRGEDAADYMEGESSPEKRWPPGIREGSGTLEVCPVSPERVEDFLRVMTPSQGCQGCWCWNHHIPPGAPDVVGEAAREAKCGALREGRAHGLLAYRDGEPVGWLALDPMEAIPGHDCAAGESSGTWAIHCVYLRPEGRGSGLLESLVSSALLQARSQGAEKLEAYARAEGPEAPVLDFLPSPATFRRLGFRPAPSPDPAYGRWVRDLGPPGRPG